MTDHIEAMARRWADGAGSLPFDDFHPDIQQAIRNRMADIWAAGVEAVITHEPCGGKGWDCPVHTNVHDFEDGCGADCPGPHTVIVKGDGTKLYAEETLFTLHLMDRAGPSEWRIE